jgi:DNA topoisomerase-1
MEQLHHNGVLVPRRHSGNGLTIRVKERTIKLTPEQEEMALAWAKKRGTPYVEDRVFAKNFHRDFSEKLGIEVEPSDVDYNDVLSFVEQERSRKADLSREARRGLAAERKAQREANKIHYGSTWVDGAQVEVANYAAEPSCIFMGRGKHPLRGRWKRGPREEDIELNLSPDAPRPPGNWKAIIWQPDAMWVARWRDKLSGKMKYVWFSDSSLLKQRKDIEKFNKARELRHSLGRVKRHIRDNLDAEDPRRRQVATICYLIDRLKIRVGDEKDPDEADTVGASTLRPEHIHYNGDGTTTFNFLGKDAVRHVFKVKLPHEVISNLKEFAANAGSTLFDGVRSKQVSEFLDEVMTGLSAKVFRTHYASEAAETQLNGDSVEPEDSEYKKQYVAKMANLEAAKVCNHRRNIPKSWSASLEKKKARLKVLRKRARKAQLELEQKIRERGTRYSRQVKEQEERREAVEEKLAALQQQLAERKQQGRSTRALQMSTRRQRELLSRQRERLEMLKTKYREQMSRLRERLQKRRQRDKAAIGKLQFQIKTKERTRDYNLTTSLKSYIDPRIYYEWGKEVDYDWKQYYSQALRRKFSWVETAGTPPESE